MTKTTELINVIDNKFENVVIKSTNLLDYLYQLGKGSEALLYSILFMPELELVSDSVLLTWNISDDALKKRFMDALTEGHESREEIESSFNFVEIGYLFEPAGRDTSDEEDELLAKLVRNAWQGWLMACYPERNFKVEILSEDITGSTVGVHFFEIR